MNKQKLDYIKDFALVSCDAEKCRCFFAVWVVTATNKVEIATYFGSPRKTEKYAVEAAWKILRPHLRKKEFPVSDTQVVKFVAIAPALEIPIVYQESLRWYQP